MLKSMLKLKKQLLDGCLLRLPDVHEMLRFPFDFSPKQHMSCFGDKILLEASMKRSAGLLGKNG